MSHLFSISEAGLIAIHGMILLVKTKSPLSVNRMSEELDYSRHHVAKVFQGLVRMNLVKSTRGPQGGFRLAKSPDKISMLNIFEAVEGKFEVPEKCPFDKKICAFHDCIFDNYLIDAANEFKEFMESKTLDTYL